MYKVLIVDDEPFVREGLKLIINWEQYGFIICGEASDGDEALKLMKELSPDLVITDIKMPEMDGLEFIEMAKDILGLNTKFIILSGYNEFKFAQRAIKYNVIYYLLKPIEEDELIIILKKVYNNLKAKELENSFSKTKNNNIIRSILDGNLEKYSKDYLQEFFNVVDNQEKRYVQVEINILKWFENLEQDEFQSKLVKLTEIIYKIINEENINCLHNDEFGKYGIILSIGILKHFNNNIDLFVNKLFNNITKILECSCLIIIGKEIMELSNLKESYKSCIEVKQLQPFNQNGIVFYNKKMQLNYNFNEEASVENLMGAIESGDKDSIVNVVNEISYNINNKQVAPEIISAYLIIFISKVITCVYKKYGDVEKFVRNNKNFNRLQASNIDDMGKAIVCFSIDISKYIKSLGDSRQNTSMYEIEKYINNNYQYDITLKKLSNIFFINPVYLGQLLRKHLGMYFNDYLETIRIEQAKKLLRRSNLKLSEIANKIGYVNSNYFINKFEKVTHLTPTQYKNSEY